MNLGLLCLDFETFFDREYSLRRLTTEAYVRDRRFKAHMVGLKWNVEPAAVYPAVLTPPRTWEEQRFHLIDWSKTAALAVNTTLLPVAAEGESAAAGAGRASAKPESTHQVCSALNQSRLSNRST